jgi:hypothetical protein
MGPKGLLPCSQELAKYRGTILFNILYYSVFKVWVISPQPSHQTGGPLLVGCPRLLIRYIRSYPTYLVIVSPIRKHRAKELRRPIMVTTPKKHFKLKLYVLDIHFIFCAICAITSFWNLSSSYGNKTRGWMFPDYAFISGTLYKNQSNSSSSLIFLCAVV